MDLTAEEILITSEVDGVTVVQFERGRIRDEREVLRALEALNRSVEGQPDTVLVLDLSNVEYLSSAGLGYMVGLLKKLRLGGGSLRLCGLRAAILELFEVMRLTQIFDIADSQSEAVESLASS